MAKYAIAIRGKREKAYGYQVISGLESRDHASVVAQLADRHRTFKATQGYEYGDLLVFEDLTLDEFAKSKGIKPSDIEKAVQGRRDERAETAARVADEKRREREDRDAAERQRLILERAQELSQVERSAARQRLLDRATQLIDAETEK